MSDHAVVLRLAGPLQAWGLTSRFNRRETDDRPTKSGVIGLLAAALGRRRTDPIEDLVALELGVRVDQPGALLRDYHTVSDLHGRPLLSASVNAKGVQQPTSPKKSTHVTTRYYLQDASFVSVIGGNVRLLEALSAAIERPAFPLALGRRACVPTQPILLRTENGTALWEGSVEEVLRRVPWQASTHWQRRCGGAARLPATVDHSPNASLVEGDHLGTSIDVPVSYAPGKRGMRSRAVRHTWIDVGDGPRSREHDPFSLLGW